MKTTSGRPAPASIPCAVILLADGFAEAPVVSSLCLLRDAGIPTCLTTLYAAWVSGEHGLTVRADCRLNHMPDAPAPGLIILPGGSGCIEALLTSPLAYRWLRAGPEPARIAILREAQAVAQATGLLNDLGVLGVSWQSEEGLADFLQPHIRRLLSSAVGQGQHYCPDDGR